LTFIEFTLSLKGEKGKWRRRRGRRERDPIFGIKAYSSQSRGGFINSAPISLFLTGKGGGRRRGGGEKGKRRNKGRVWEGLNGWQPFIQFHHSLCTIVEEGGGKGRGGGKKMEKKIKGKEKRERNVPGTAESVHAMIVTPP